jgi:hypothetical protein
MWNGTPAVVVRALVPKIPEGGSTVLRGLARRLLLTAATAPEGADQAAQGGVTLVALRTEKLNALGDADGVTALTAATPGSARNPRLGRLAIDTALAAGKTEQACAEVGPALAGGFDAGLSRVQVLCHFLAGRTLEGNLALDMLREGKQADPAFVAAAEALSGLPPVPSEKLSLSVPEPLHVALFSAAKQPLPADALGHPSPLALKAIAGAAGLPIDQRLVAAERAEAAGLLPAEAVRTLYAGALFTPEELSAAIPKGEQGSPRTGALLYRAAGAIADEGVRAQLVAKALDLATLRGHFASTARIFQPLVATLRPDPAQASVAPTLARALLSAGKPEAAAKWLDVAKAGPDPNAAARLWPLAALNGVSAGNGIDLPAYAAWRATQEGVPPETFAHRAALVLGALAGRGARIPDAAWLDALALPAGGPQPALFALMQGGALDARVGITVLATLVAVGEVPLAKADPMVLAEAVSALTVVGLADEARALATEALLANGI